MNQSVHRRSPHMYVSVIHNHTANIYRGKRQKRQSAVNVQECAIFRQSHETEGKPNSMMLL